MASQGPNNPSAAADDTSIGTLSWTTPTNVYSNNGARAYRGPMNSGEKTYYLKVTGFGFSIPSGATIDGIVVEYERNAPFSSGSIKDYAVRIVKGGAIGATDRSTATAWPGSEAYESHGGASDLWGESWTDGDINASNFGVAISAQCTASSGDYAQIDHVRATVYYTAAAAGQPAAKRMGGVQFAQTRTSAGGMW